MGAVTDYELAGLVLRSPFELPAHRHRGGGGEAVVVSTADGGATPWPAEPDVLAAGRLAGQEIYRVAALDGGAVIRFTGRCDFLLEPPDRRITCFGGGGRPDLRPVFLAGTVLALHLMLEGHGVLHASAVSVGGRAVAFVGPSGQGKTALAALCCLAGAGLVTDDVLRIDTGDGAVCHRGARALRLRRHNATLATAFGGPVVRSGDGRTTVAPDPSAPTVPLDAVVVPRVSGSVARLAASGLGQRDALLELTAATRISGLVDARLVAAQFEHAAALARTVPVVRLDVPRQLLEDVGAGAEILDAVNRCLASDRPSS